MIGCALDDRSSCPRSSPQQLTVTEVGAIRELVTSDDYRHVPTGILSRLAQRLGNTLDTIRNVEKLVAFYVEQHYKHLPHTAFHGQTPDEMYFVTGADIPKQLAAAKVAARQSRLASNLAVRCQSCSEPVAISN
jgi:hypothetical protein